MATSRKSGLRIQLSSMERNSSVPKLTNSEKCKQYQERIKNDEALAEIQRQKDNERNRKNRCKERSPASKERIREKNRLRTQKYRAKKKAEGLKAVNQPSVLLVTRSAEKVTKAELEANGERKRKKNVVNDKSHSNGDIAEVSTEVTTPTTVSKEARRKSNYRLKKFIVNSGKSTALNTLLDNNSSASTSTSTSFSEKKEEELNTLKRKRNKSALSKRKLLLDFTDGKTSHLSNEPYKRRKLNENTVAAVQFMEETAVTIPGKFKNTKKILPKKMKRIVRDFQKVNPNANTTLRTFYRHRPPYIKTNRQQTYRQCLCEVCVNIDLKLDALNKKLRDESTIDGRDVLSEMSLCKEAGLACYERNCDDCGVHLVKTYLETHLTCNEEESVKWFTWEFVQKNKGSRKEKLTKETELSYLITCLLDDLKMLSKHIFVHRWQFHQYKCLLGKLPILKNQAVVVCDFAENYLCKYQDEVQSAHWGYNQVTVHPTVLFYPCQNCDEQVTDYIIFLSDDLTHDANMVKEILDITREHAKRKGIEKLFVWSDGCASQYKSKLPFYFASQTTDERAFFGSRHGKGPCDACGGVIKRIVDDDVLSGQVIIQNASSMCEHLKQHYTLPESITPECCHTFRSFELIKEITRFPSFALKTVPGTRNIHSLKPITNQLVSVRPLSCFCNYCLNIGDKLMDDNHRLVTDWKETKIEFSKQWTEPSSQEKTELFESLEGREDSTCSSVEDTTDLLDTSDIVVSTGRLEIDSCNLNDSFLNQIMSFIDNVVDKSSLIPGQFVTVSLPYGKIRKEFAAEIVEIKGDEILLNYMEEVKENVFKWPIIPDGSTEPIQNIVKILQAPSLTEGESTTRVQFYKF